MRSIIIAGLLSLLMFSTTFASANSAKWKGTWKIESAFWRGVLVLHSKTVTRKVGKKIKKIKIVSGSLSLYTRVGIGGQDLKMHVTRVGFKGNELHAIAHSGKFRESLPRERSKRNDLFLVRYERRNTAMGYIAMPADQIDPGSTYPVIATRITGSPDRMIEIINRLKKPDLPSFKKSPNKSWQGLWQVETESDKGMLSLAKTRGKFRGLVLLGKRYHFDPIRYGGTGGEDNPHGIILVGTGKRLSDKAPFSVRIELQHFFTINKAVGFYQVSTSKSPPKRDGRNSPKKFPIVVKRPGVRTFAK